MVQRVYTIPGMESQEAPTDVRTFIARARKALGMTLEEFGAKFGRTKSNAHAWEKGLHEPAFVLLQQMSLESGVPLPGSVVKSAASARQSPLTEPAGVAVRNAIAHGLPEDHLRELLDELGKQLSKAPSTSREAIAANLVGWARDGGGGPWSAALFALLTSAQESGLTQQEADAISAKPKRRGELVRGKTEHGA